ncbi:ethanolamine ammonia-lyase [Pseudoalteromonas sp. S3776]|uniref:ethanolamine ammonia-lyase subunit EutC n=1 Tax=unclassified Pseudoalteromonas TaxID=194690 RepID=UPI00110A06E2|nr:MULTISPECIES: ethanolamine ammonia-lyase subunit EutC [unclassified Pseudoalteromonas]TMO73252.1 ethanolamine ammonia-lyase [Pseudoalteromonas sp. S3785]TMO76033.1 ethanolamine ammonia-lyase [Pseudoalteromonas sp. S3776]
MKSVEPINIKTRNYKSNGKVVENPWRDLRRFTDARIGLGRAGISLPTSEMLAFQLSHAQARDAVNFPLDIGEMTKSLSTINGLCDLGKPLNVQSEAADRVTYLQRPDLGRKLNEAGRNTLLNTMQSSAQAQYDLAIVVVDGLSSLAVQKNAAPFITELLKQLPTEPSPYKIAPITLVMQGRVAIGDDIGELLNAQVVMVLIGERPGLSSPDSLGLYLTWAPKTGLNDACRNCISNIRPAGLSYFEAARRAVYLLQEAKKCGLTGVNLKDRTQDDVIEHQVQTTNFLIAE